jgi:hypothetical protein
MNLAAKKIYIYIYLWQYIGRKEKETDSHAVVRSNATSREETDEQRASHPFLVKHRQRRNRPSVRPNKASRHLPS